MSNGNYETDYKKSRHFSFGKNWQSFLKSLDNSKIYEAERSLRDFLGENKDIGGATFVDIGSGSGLFSLAAYNLGAGKVVSVDVDDFSVACASFLKNKKNNPLNWEIRQGSALDSEFVSSLGKFDIVYSWGVLHHTGNMYDALINVQSLVKPGGCFYLALYNNNTEYKLEGTSEMWKKIKVFYNQSSLIVKKIMQYLYTTYYIFGLIANKKNPLTYIKKYHSLRGMDFNTDIKDWLGGLPYEFAKTEEVISFLEQREMQCVKINRARSIGCNEFLFMRRDN